MSWSLKNVALRTVHYTTKTVFPLLRFPIPQVISGPGSVKRLPELISTLKMNRVLIVTDKGLSAAGLVEKVTAPLAMQGVFYAVFDAVQANPSIQNVEEGLKVYVANKCNGIVALGGGSPMDCAKLIGARASNPKKPVAKMRGKFRVWKALPPLIAIPTTAGTGSETTVAAVVSDPVAHEKFAVIDLKLVPPIAILDPELMVGLPPHITASTGMDALTHAIEAYIGIHGTSFTNENAEKATRIIIENLESVYQNGSNLDKRNQLALASFYGGSAFTRASVGYVHAIAHNMGGLYGVPHGLANAIILPYVLESCLKEAAGKLAKLAVVSGLGKADEPPATLARRFLDKIKSMNSALGIPKTIKELKEADIPLIVKRALAEANLDYPVPRIMNKEEMTALVRLLLP